ncbi:5'-methylthioadenosine/S-adenosylhomocysteine nucleosidase [Novosphingobium aquimarinum]|uniref:5'-methylthioadenosine/S-adenosylhomocysteine nucleosidase n=1 Tax=Novosphingobium aquimarinum TaxID=2682494 RepID=UPI0012EB3FC8|nr:5'-methylthioadenosine/S-adenosylhomocysteine nucleosidase [Novosphingobium aquimarinum]
MARLLPRLLVFLLSLSGLIAAGAQAAERIDDTPRTLVMTAYAPEWNALASSVEEPVPHEINGWRFIVGQMDGKPIVLMESGVSTVNAAMNTQIAIDRFNVKRIVFSGVAGGVDPALSIGDVLIADKWGQYLESAFARWTPEGYKPPIPVNPDAPANWEFIYPNGVYVGNASEPRKRHYFFPVDPTMLKLAEAMTSLKLDRCVERSPEMPSDAEICLPKAPKVVVGGTGVTAPVYMDNAQFREYLFRGWGARALEMESGAVSQVAYANQVPVIHIRSLSDLAGGDHGKNASEVFEDLAAVNAARVLHAYLRVLPD